MNDWTIDIETASGLTSSAEDLEWFAEALDRDERALSASASINTETGVLSATYTVIVDDPVTAARDGVSAFVDALVKTKLKAGVGLSATIIGQLSRAAVEPVKREPAIA